MQSLYHLHQKHTGQVHQQWQHGRSCSNLDWSSIWPRNFIVQFILYWQIKFILLYLQSTHTHSKAVTFNSFIHSCIKHYRSASSTISILSKKTRVGRPVTNLSCESPFPVPPCCTASAGLVSSLSRHTGLSVDCQQTLTQTDWRSPPCGLL